MGQFVVRGIPPSVLQDSWWLEASKPKPAEAAGTAGRNWRRATGLLAVLIALADVLMLGYAPGISLAVFALILAGAVWWLSVRCTRQMGPAILFGLSLLPVVEYVQALSVAFLLGGSTVAMCWALKGRCEAAAVRRFLRLFPTITIWQAVNLVKQVRLSTGSGKATRHLLRDWGFPLGGALLLVGLMIAANPVLSDWLANVLRMDLQLDRILFWIGAAFMIWPFLAVAVQPGLLAPKMGPWRKGPTPRLGLNARSVANALILFNLLLALQTVMDAAFLWGHAELPEGLSHAEYAHRGAYPLLVTALLAGAFALAARPYLSERRGLTGWMMLWLTQNVLLVASSLMRLSLYVEAYGLTYLRVHAAIWMALVALGLCLTGWQILKGRSNQWLVVRTVILGLGVLYACCFVNFAALIARWNLDHPTRFDMYYACQLGSMAAAELSTDHHLKTCAQPPVIRNWREWGFRADRVIRSLNVEPSPEKDHENSRRG